jgi:hypothetical protein
MMSTRSGVFFGEEEQAEQICMHITRISIIIRPVLILPVLVFLDITIALSSLSVAVSPP